MQGFTDVATGQHISYREVASTTKYLSTSLQDVLKVRKGDVALLFSNNDFRYPIAMLAALRIGMVACGVSPDYTVDELTHSLAVSQAKLIFTTAENLDRAHEAAAQHGLSASHVIRLDASAEDAQGIEFLTLAGRAKAEQSQARAFQIPRGKTNAQSCAFLCFSSGTTGLPKAVKISHANVIAQCLQIQQITPDDHDKVIAALPFYHITGIVHQLNLPILLGANVYIIARYTLEAFLETASRNRVKELLVVPPILLRMVREDGLVSRYDLSHVKRFSSGAAPLPKTILDELAAKFPGTGFKQGYGLSESCSAIASHPPSKYAYRNADKAGMLVASTEVRIVDVTSGEDVGAGEEGEIWARGPQMAIMGYEGNATATAEAFDADGFLHTGDVGKMDAEGLLHITDRMKELIKVKGVGVAPAELEQLLLSHPDVDDVAVCGINDERTGERPKAFVVLKASERADSVSEQAGRSIMQFVRERKARSKWLVEVEAVDAIPKSAAGKILRRQLRSGDRKSTFRGRVWRDVRAARL